MAPFRLATTLLRCTRELTRAGCTMGMDLSNRGQVDTVIACVETRTRQRRACPSVRDGLLRATRVIIRRAMLGATHLDQRGAVLLALAGGMVLASGALASGYYVVTTRSEARAATPKITAP